VKNTSKILWVPTPPVHPLDAPKVDSDRESPVESPIFSPFTGLNNIIYYDRMGYFYICYDKDRSTCNYMSCDSSNLCVFYVIRFIHIFLSHKPVLERAPKNQNIRPKHTTKTYDQIYDSLMTTYDQQYQRIHSPHWTIVYIYCFILPCLHIICYCFIFSPFYVYDGHVYYFYVLYDIFA
jgi:hypothetical protein